MNFLLWDFSALLILFKVMEYVQAHMVEGGSMLVFKHRLGQTVYLNAFSEVILWQFHPSINCLHPHILAQGHEGAGPFPSMHPGQVRGLSQG